jgi:hypothetical protein
LAYLTGLEKGDTTSLIRFFIHSLTALLLVSITTAIVHGREVVDPNKSQSIAAVPGNPAYGIAVHNVGTVGLAVQNNGTFGLDISSRFSSARDFFTGDRVSTGCEYPRRTGLESLLNASLWVGAIVGNDTLVSTGLDGWDGGFEMYPDDVPWGNMIHRSITDPDLPGYSDAVSEQDFIAGYTDTLRGVSRDYFNARPHKPLYIEVRQASYAWSYPYAEDIVLIDLAIKNIGYRNLEDVYIGLYFDHAVGFVPGFAGDDICGFVESYPVATSCGEFEDTVNIAWAADNNGDPFGGKFIISEGPGNPADYFFQRKSHPHAIGTRVLQVPEGGDDFSFNWWISNYDPKYDFGPRRKDSLRDFRTGGLGTPHGDLNKYHVLSNGEHDYDQIMTSEIESWDSEWLYPDYWVAYRASRGMDSRFLLSYGPYTINTTQTVPFTFAIFAGKDFQTNPENGGLLGHKPEKYYTNVDFSDLVTNARWADWIYDNPGVDTDGDGYYGKFLTCTKDSALTDSGWAVVEAETTFYAGDGVPDFRGAAAPPAPPFEVFPELNGLRVTFNGQLSETTRDFLTNIIDFEGYNIYYARDDRQSSFTLVANYDRPNFDKYVWNMHRGPSGSYELQDVPFSLDSLRCLYGDSCHDTSFDPYDHAIDNPYSPAGFPDSVFYFSPHGGNAHIWGRTTDIRRVYPDAQLPPTDADLDTLDGDYFTDEGLLKYYEYEFTLENLLPTVPYWMSVTAYDFGSPKSDLAALETSITAMAQMVYPYASEDQATGEDLEVYIYPNPYRKDANYRQAGYEGRGDDMRPNYRVRALNFANLPPKCTIRIFSLDGDLIRELEHDMDPGDPNSSHHQWDLISRNTQEIMSGLYYWTVEDPDGQVQMGKLVVLM